MVKVVLEGYILVPKDDLSAVIRELPEHIKNTKNESGCILFEVKQDLSNQYKLDVYEEFKDEHAFSLHQDRVRCSKWGEVAKNCDRRYEIRYVEE